MPESYTMKLPLEQLLRYKVLDYRGADGQPLQECEFVANFSWTYSKICNFNPQPCLRHSFIVQLTFKATVETVGSRVVLTAFWTDTRGGSHPYSIQVMPSGPVWKTISRADNKMYLSELVQHNVSGEVILCFTLDHNHGDMAPSSPDNDLGVMMPRFLALPPTPGITEIIDFSEEHNEMCFFEVDGKKLYTQRKLLVKSGDVFERMFTDDMEEKGTGRIDVKDFSVDEVEMFLRALYSPDIICHYLLENTRTLFSLYKIVDKYNVISLLEICTRAFLYTKLDQDSICDAIKVAHDSHDEALWFSCFVASHIIPKEFWRSEKFRTFTANNVEAAGEFMMVTWTTCSDFKGESGFGPKCCLQVGMTILTNGSAKGALIMNGEVDSFSDPEDFVDKITDEELVGDLIQKRPTEKDTSDSVIIVDCIPVVGPDRLPKLEQVLGKMFSKCGVVQSAFYPVSEDGKTKGYCFVEYEKKDQAESAVQLLDGHRLDKQHRLFVNLFSDLDKFRTVQEKWEPPKVKPYKDHGNMKSWLMDRQCRDQFLAQYENGERVQIALNNPPHREPIVLQEKQRWTETTCRWSPRGTYLGTYHNQGVALWGGENFEQIVKFPHPEVRQMDFSPCERFLVTFAEPKRYGEVPDAIRIWDIFTGEIRRGFPLSQQDMTRVMTWPYFRWSPDGLYFAAVKDDKIVMYESSTFKVVEKQLAKLDRVRDFQWSQKHNTIAYYQAEKDASPAVVGMMQVDPSVSETDRMSRNKNIFSVCDAKVHWQKSGNYVGFRVDRYNKKKWDDKDKEYKYANITQNIEVFFVNEKGIPNAFIEVKDNVRDFAWEPSGPRFCVIHGEMKNSTSFYSVRDSRITLIKDCEQKHQLNRILWAPAGGFCVLAGLKVPGSGTLIFTDCSGNDVTVMNTQEHTGVTSASWDPTGRFFTSSVSMWDQGKGDFGYMMWNFQGIVRDKRQMQQFCYLSWRPRPPSILPEDKIKEVKKNMKHYVKVFEEKDRQMLSKASKEILEKRRNQVEEFRNWQTERRKLHEGERDERVQLRGVDTEEATETDFAEEKFELLLEEKEETIE